MGVEMREDVRVSYVIQTVVVNNWAGVVAEIVIEKKNAPKWELEAVKSMEAEYIGSLGGKFEIRDVSVNERVGSYVIKAEYSGYHPSGVPVERIKDTIIEELLKLRFRSPETNEDWIEDTFEDFDPWEYWEFVEWEE
jgi:hypothetical protein